MVDQKLVLWEKVKKTVTKLTVDKEDNNFKRLVWSYDDVLECTTESLLELVTQLGNSSELNHLDSKSSIYMIETNKVLKAQFIKLMQLLGLTIRHYSVFLVVPPNTVGPTHTDTYYGNTCNVSLHFDLNQVGKLDFFQSDIIGEPSLANGTDYNFIDDKIAANLKCVGCMPAQKSVSLVKTNKPHRAVNNTDKFRVVLTCRFENNPTFEYVESKLKKFIQ